LLPMIETTYTHHADIQNDVMICAVTVRVSGLKQKLFKIAFVTDKRGSSPQEWAPMAAKKTEPQHSVVFPVNKRGRTCRLVSIRGFLPLVSLVVGSAIGAPA
jgi:hypothetical protein